MSMLQVKDIKFVIYGVSFEQSRVALSPFQSNGSLLILYGKPIDSFTAYPKCKKQGSPIRPTIIIPHMTQIETSCRNVFICD
jgi:hypothetical protein